MPPRNLAAEAVANLSMKGYGAQRIATELNLPLADVRRLIKLEFVIPPSQIGEAFRPPAINAEIPQESVDHMITMYKGGSSIATIAEETQTTTTTVLTHLRKRGIDPEPQNRPWALDEYDYLLEHVNDPWPVTAAVLGRSHQQVKHRYCMLRRMGFNVPQRRFINATGTLHAHPR